jgi:geranylgeranyl diphosphate/geranylgeranyl-bacteriochlorophyllide a reductase
MRIGIIGASLAGGYAGYLLARAGHEVLVFERNLDREKPCGGGVTEKAIASFPEIAALPGPYRTIRSMAVISAIGTEAHLPIERPFRIFSRNVLDKSVRNLATEAGALVRNEVVRQIENDGDGWRVNEDERFDFLIGAGGYTDPLARNLGRVLSREDTAMMVGYFIPGDFGDKVIIRMLGEFPGYIWMFPRIDHGSVGLMVPAKAMNRRGAYAVLDRFLQRYYPNASMEQAKRYAAPAPMVINHTGRPAPCGKNWALIGDAAGLCDPLTGEGIHYAFLSARLLAQSLEEGSVASYATKLDEQVWPDFKKATDFKRKFFRWWVWEGGVFFMKRSPSCANVAADFVAGSQDYLSLRPVTFKLLPKMGLEALATMTGLARR